MERRHRGGSPGDPARTGLAVGGSRRHSDRAKGRGARKYHREAAHLSDKYPRGGKGRSEEQGTVPGTPVLAGAAVPRETRAGLWGARDGHGR